MTPVQKLVWPATTRAFVERGSSLLAGPVVRMGDAARWRTAGEVLAGYGVDGSRVASVDVLRFEPTALTQVRVPVESDATSVAGYGSGFLPGGVAGPVPVWDVVPTTVPRDAELWRVFADGRQELVSAYAGPAFGWRGSGVFVPPTMLVGPRAVWRGAEYAASWIDAAHIELVSVAQEPPDGFEQTRPFVFRRVVEAGECDRLFEVSFTATWNGLACSIVQSNQDQAAVVLHCDLPFAQRAGAVVLEPGVFWKLVPQAELTQVQGVERELPAAA